jgi:NAD(P)-dependent dehydrogenase (short-subunit alcohol dehydrogenase family)
MAYRHAIGTTTYVFDDLRDLLAKASPPRSGDRLAGIAAESAEQMVAARIALAAAAAAPWGRLDVLVNNAGTTKHVPHGDLDGLSSEDFQRLFGVNTIGPFQMVRAARDLLEAGAKASGRASSVVNVSSVAGISGIGSSVAYAASKGALNTITISLARALAPLIRVNAVCPGYIDTPWFTKGRGVEGAAKVRDSVVAKVPLKRASSAEDVANVVCFLALPQSGNLTGEIVRIDAGAHLIT